MNLQDFDYVIVGAGLFGAVIAERIANDLNQPVLVIEKRTHTGGNCHSEVHAETGIEYHKYGTHIFHTSNKAVWDYFRRFTDINGYFHQVLTTYKNRVYQMPINLETINQFYEKNLKPYEVEEFLDVERAKEVYDEPASFEEQAINFVGRPLYEAFLKGYTEKQWGRSPREISASVLKRLPFRANYSETYYFDQYQGIPLDGYGAIFDRMLASRNIELLLNTDYFEIKNELKEKALVVYSGEIDRLFSYKHGDLEYRTLEFEFETVNVEDYQGTSVMNYAELDVRYTRIHEPKHLHPERAHSPDKTLIIREYSKACHRSEPYYPIGGERNRELYQKYKNELKAMHNLIVGGRLGDYRYYDMHHVIEAALSIYEERIKK